MDNKSDEKVWKCLEQAQLKEFIESLPEGMDTIAGERGVNLSDGQRQRIAIARVLFQNQRFLLWLKQQQLLIMKLKRL